MTSETQRRQNVKMRTLLILAAVLLAGGCASGKGGGGSGQGSGPATDPALQPLRPGYEPSVCGTLYGYPVQCVPSQRAAIDAAMDSGSQGRMPSAETFEALGMSAPPGAPTSSAGHSPSSAQTPAVQLHMVVYTRTQGDPKTFNPFSSRPGNPGIDSVGLGLQYQSFGVWNDYAGFKGQIIGWSQGQITSGYALPSNGSARFTGKLVGFHVSSAGVGSTARADVLVDANFSSRSLGFTSTNTTLNGGAAAHLDLSGTLMYAPNQSSFNGTLRSASGTLSGPSKGQFYGPKAEELGGAFTVWSTGGERFAGAYGAKR